MAETSETEEGTTTTDTALTAQFVNVPAHHTTVRFGFELAFSETLADVSHKTFTGGDGHAGMLTVTNGRLVKAARIVKTGAERNRRWHIVVAPGGNSDITVTLQASVACGETGAMCSEDGQALSSSVSATIPGPPGLSVADATVEEAEGATLDFAVSLSRPASVAVTVDYATSSGTATTGSDYTAVSGTLSFSPGETAKTISVPVLDDVHDEGAETLTLTLSNPAGTTAWLVDATATGTITNDDLMPTAWLARFGRTVAGQAVDAIGVRLEGRGGPHVTVGGRSLDFSGGAAARREEAGLGDEAFAMTDKDGRTRTMSGRELLLGSSFRLSAGGEARGPEWTAWGRFARDGFDAYEDGVRLDGSVTSGFLGADVGHERWLGGVALSLSESEGGYAGTETGAGGDVESRLTAVYPYARLGVSERFELWGLAGFGEGELEMTHAHGGSAEERYRTDIALRMGTVGARGEVLSPAASDGLAVAVKSDALWVRTSSEAVEGRSGSHGNLAASEADVTRLRLAMEGSRSFEVGAGRLVPSLELGLRYDGGDAETGAGIEVGASLRYAAERVSVEGSVRRLVAHESTGYEEWGAAGAVRIDPGEESGRGLSLTVASTWGAVSGDAERLWSVADPRGLAPGGEFEAGRGFEAELGYGLGLGRAPRVVTPYAGVSFGEASERAWRIGARWAVVPGVALGLEATRRDAAADDGEAANALMLRGALRW